MKVFLIFFLLFSINIFSQNISLDSLDATSASEDKGLSDIDSIIEEDLSVEEEKDDLNALLNEPEDKNIEKGEKKSHIAIDPDLAIDESVKIVNEPAKTSKIKIKTLNSGEEEKKLLRESQFLKSRFLDGEWGEVYSSAKVDKYVIQEGDWLWKISEKLFGSGFYYSKIWSLNPQITNPHEIEPGMVLLFDMGDPNKMPDVVVDETSNVLVKKDFSKKRLFHFEKFGDDVEPKWIREREDLINKGAFFQYISEDTYESLSTVASKSLNKDYLKYETPVYDFIRNPDESSEGYDEVGFDKNSKVQIKFKEGFHLNTFVTTNIIQNLGMIKSSKSEASFLQSGDNIYIKFDSSINVKPGDEFSVYSSGGKIAHKISDRQGYKYTVTGQVKVIRQMGEVWEAELFEVSGIIKRKDYVTYYIPKINKITKSLSKRRIEAAILSSFKKESNLIYTGDIAYIDRGRLDGVEIGNVFNIYDFYDKNTKKRISNIPSYKVGELVVISLTDNFSTVVVGGSSNRISVGQLSFSKTPEDVLLQEKRKNRNKTYAKLREIEQKSLKELDIELKLDDLNDDLLQKADKIKLTEEDIEKLERQERKNSIITEDEKDLKALEDLEKQIEDTEKGLNEAKIDEDKFLEQQNLNAIEKKKKKSEDAFANINEIEKDVGLKYIDGKVKSKDNPYGLTEFDLEEIDELLNTESL